MTHQRLEERRRTAGRDDDPVGADACRRRSARQPLFEPNLIFVAGDRSKIAAPRSAAARARPSAARYGSTVAPSRVRRAPVAAMPVSVAAARPVTRARLDAGLPARFQLPLQQRPPARPYGRPPASRCGASWHLRSSRRTSAAKSRAARRHACQARRASRSPTAVSTCWKLTPGVSAIHPRAEPLLPRPSWAASISATFTPAAANA